MQRTHTRMKSNGKNNIREFRISNNSINMIRRETIVDLLLKTQAVSSKITKFPKIFQTEGKTSTKTINSIKLKRSSIDTIKTSYKKKIFPIEFKKRYNIPYSEFNHEGKKIIMANSTMFTSTPKKSDIKGFHKVTTSSGQRRAFDLLDIKAITTSGFP